MRHVSHQLCARFVTDDPPDGCVDDAVTAWRASDGDMREVLRAIFRSPDFWAPRAFRAKVKTPLEFVVSAVRAVGGDPDTTPRLSQVVTRLGQPLYLEPSPAGYPESQDEWVNSGALLHRMNAAVALAAGRLPGVSVALDGLVPRSTDADSLIDAVDDAAPGRRATHRSHAGRAAGAARATSRNPTCGAHADRGTGAGRTGVSEAVGGWTHDRRRVFVKSGGLALFSLGNRSVVPRTRRVRAAPHLEPAARRPARARLPLHARRRGRPQRDRAARRPALLSRTAAHRRPQSRRRRPGRPLRPASAARGVEAAVGQQEPRRGACHRVSRVDAQSLRRPGLHGVGHARREGD